VTFFFARLLVVWRREVGNCLGHVNLARQPINFHVSCVESVPQFRRRSGEKKRSMMTLRT